MNPSFLNIIVTLFKTKCKRILIHDSFISVALCIFPNYKEILYRYDITNQNVVLGYVDGIRVLLVAF